MPTLLLLGATSDIGLAIAETFAANGYHIQLAARNPQLLSEAQKDLQIRYNITCQVYAFDAVQFQTHQDFYNSLLQLPDVVVYAAGYMMDNEKAVGEWEEAKRTIDTNYTGAVSVLNIVAAHFARRGTGVIVGISSVAGERGRKSNYIYGSAKAAFTAYLSGLRHALYSNGVHVVTVLPGFVDTKMTQHLTLPPKLTALPEQVGNAVYKAVNNKTNVLYVKPVWRWIMQVITNIPEPLFKKTKL